MSIKLPVRLLPFLFTLICLLTFRADVLSSRGRKSRSASGPDDASTTR